MEPRRRDEFFVEFGIDGGCGSLSVESKLELESIESGSAGGG